MSKSIHDKSRYDRLYSLIVGKHREHHNVIHMLKSSKEWIIEPELAKLITNDLLNHDVNVPPVKIGDKLYILDSNNNNMQEIEVIETGVYHFFVNTLDGLKSYLYSNEDIVWYKDYKQAEKVLNMLKNVKSDINEIFKPE